MKAYALSLGVGILVGVIYALFQVRSPAPPVIALVGLLGILVGEQLPSLAREVWTREQVKVSWIQGQVKAHMFGEMPAPACARSSAALPDGAIDKEACTK